MSEHGTEQADPAGERGAVNHRLENLQARYRVLIEQVPAITYTVELGEPNRTVFISPQVETILGFTVEEWRGDVDLWLRQLHPEDREGIEREVRAKNLSGEPFSLEYRALAKDGRVVWIRNHAVYFPDEAGAPRVVQGVMLDITEQKLAEARTASLAHDLRERVKELTCLYAISELLEHRDWPLPQILQGIASIAPTGFQYPEDAVARIRHEDQVFQSDRFQETPWRLGVDILVQGEKRGTLEVFYRVERPVRDLGPFDHNEQRMLQAVGSRVGKLVERIQAEKALQRATKRYEDLVTNLNVGIYRNTPGAQGRFLEANPAIAAMFEAESREEFMKHHVSELYQNPSQRQSFSDKMVRDGFVENEELELVTLKGRPFWAAITAVKQMDEQGNIYFDGMVENITERKQAELRLHVQAQALQAAANGILISSPDGTIVWVNTAFTELTGYPAEEVIGKSTRLLKSGKQSDDFYRRMWQSISAGKVWHGEIVNRRKDGKLYTEDMTITPVRDHSGAIVNFIAIKQDITRRKRAEKIATAIYRIAETAGYAGDMTSLCAAIHAILSPLIYSRNFYIALHDEGHDRLYFPYFVDEKDPPPSPRAVANGLTDYVFKSGRSFWLRRPEALTELQQAGFEIKGSEPYDWLGVPLQRAERTFGVVALQSYSNKVRFSLRDEEFMTYVSQQIATVIERKRSEAALELYAEQLRTKNVEMEDDLTMAREIQQALMPQNFPSFPPAAPPEQSALRFHKLYLPSGQVGGDFFDVLPLSDTQASILICDVMGHGMRAALVMAIVRGITEELTLVSDKPGDFLTELNRDFTAVFKQAEPGMLATALHLVVDVSTGDLLFANAGHPSPVIVRRRNGNVQAVGAAQGGRAGPALGLTEEAEYHSTRLSLEIGDVLLLYTDGLCEVERPDRETFGEERLRAALASRMHLPVPDMLEGVLKEAQDFSAGQGFNDDVCLLAAEVTALGVTGG